MINLRYGGEKFSSVEHILIIFLAHIVFVQADSAAADKEGLVAGADTDQAASQAARAEPQQHGGRHAQAGQGVPQVSE